VNTLEETITIALLLIADRASSSLPSLLGTFVLSGSFLTTFWLIAAPTFRLTAASSVFRAYITEGIISPVTLTGLSARRFRNHPFARMVPLCVERPSFGEPKSRREFRGSAIIPRLIWLKSNFPDWRNPLACPQWVRAPIPTGLSMGRLVDGLPETSNL
jgi:hypothetical protein